MILGGLDKHKMPDKAPKAALSVQYIDFLKRNLQHIKTQPQLPPSVLLDELLQNLNCGEAAEAACSMCS